jgi:hypothetical protein
MRYRVRWWRTVLFAATAVVAGSLVSVSPAAATASVSAHTGANAAGASALPAGLGLHVPSKAERSALPARIRDAVTSVSGQVEIVNANSNYCMGVPYSVKTIGTKITQARCHFAPGQLWRLVSVDFGIYNLYNPNSDKCLDITNNHANGVQPYIWACDLPSGNYNQIFNILAVGGGTNDVTIRSAIGGKCIEVYHSSYTQNAPVDSYTCNGTLTQRWYFWS